MLNKQRENLEPLTKADVQQIYELALEDKLPPNAKALAARAKFTANLYSSEITQAFNVLGDALRDGRTKTIKHFGLRLIQYLEAREWLEARENR